MRRKIPSTGALVAFDASARHLSITRAAYELSLSESAISRQIIALEEFLGVQLFSRVKKRLHLTDAGKSYCAAIQETLSKLENDTQTVMAYDGARAPFELAVPGTLALKWLMPRLHEFTSKHPGITINITAREEPFEFDEESFDAAIHFDHPVWTHAFTRFLFSEELIPVCTPALLGGKPCTHPRQLSDCVLLHKSGRLNAWWQWFDTAGCPDTNAFKGPHYTMYAMMIEAARTGVGVGLVPRIYVHHEIANGELVVPWELRVPSTKNYYFVYPEHSQDSPAIKLLLDWLLHISNRPIDIAVDQPQ